MNTVVIKQNRSNRWVAVSMVMAMVLMTVTTAGMVVARPVKLSFEWFLLPILFIASLIMGAAYLHMLIRPRDHVISISEDKIIILDQPYFRWSTRSFDPSEVVQICYNSESSSHLKTRDGTKHLLSDILIMKRNEIFAALSELHPHIKLSVIH